MADERTREHGPERVLVAHASRLGSTAGIARAIGDVLAEGGFAVDVAPVREVQGLTSYDRVVVGSAIRYDRWLGEARRFVAKHRDSLAARPVALFLTCLAMTDADGEGAAKGEAYAHAVSDLVPGVSAPEVGRFAGVLEPAGAPLVTGLLLRAISRATGVPRGDHRDWDAVRGWAEALRDRWAGAPGDVPLDGSGRDGGD